jgi:hypothetical protein
VRGRSCGSQGQRAALDAGLLGELEGCCDAGLAGGLPSKLRAHSLPALFPDLQAVAVSAGLTHTAPCGKAPGARIPGTWARGWGGEEQLGSHA